MQLYVDGELLPREAAKISTFNHRLRYGDGYVQYHILFSISALIAAANRQPAMVVEPRYTLSAAESAADFLPMAATCLENALQTAAWRVATSALVERSLVVGRRL